MFRFANDIPLPALIGQALISLDWQNPGVTLKFSQGEEIRIFHCGQFYSENGILNDEFLKGLCGEHLERYTMRSAEKLEISFSGGAALVFLDMPGDLEKFSFLINGVEYVV